MKISSLLLIVKKMKAVSNLHFLLNRSKSPRFFTIIMWFIYLFILCKNIKLLFSHLNKKFRYCFLLFWFCFYTLIFLPILIFYWYSTSAPRTTRKWTDDVANILRHKGLALAEGARLSLDRDRRRSFTLDTARYKRTD